MQDVILALLAKEPAHGYELRQRLVEALGPAGQALNAGQVYVTLTRLERTGLVTADEAGDPRQRNRRVYELSPSGRERVAEWMADVSWPKVAPTDFHLKLVAAATTGLADPITLVDSQRNEVLRQLSEVQRLAAAEGEESIGGLLLEGAGLRLAADVRWLELCEQRWLARVDASRAEGAEGAERAGRKEHR